MGDQEDGARKIVQSARMARDARWWRVLSNRLRELWLMEALLTRRPHLAQQRSRLKGFARTCAGWRTRRKQMRDAQRSGDGHPDVWREPELQVLKGVHCKVQAVLDKLHKRDRKAREKAIAEYAREASQEAAGSPHRLTKPRPVWCPRDAAQV